MMNFGSDHGGGGGGGGRPPANYPLTRQPSVYSLTFDEFVNSMGGSGKDFGSMNMDELLKNIWTAEEVQTVASISGGQQGGSVSGGQHLQRQGSLTLPRTLSQKTVDEVWKDISTAGKDAPNLPQRQQTLGEMTLEEFLVKAGVVREDAQAQMMAGNSNGIGLSFQQMNKCNQGMMGNQIAGNGNLPLNVNGARSNQQQLQNSKSPQQQPNIFPKQPVMAYAGQIPLGNNAQIGNQGMRGGMGGVMDQGLNGNLVQSSALQGGGGGGMGMVGLGGGAVRVATGSPANQLSCDELGKSNDDNSSVSPLPYVFNGGLRGRKNGGAVEKVIERRQRRMIKNRESAARSRARKQIHERLCSTMAYTMELEAEVAKLKEENEELRRKQAQIMEMQVNQVKEMTNMQQGAKKRCLRRTQTGPW